MKILFCTQTIDKQNPAMSFFHSWIEHFSPSYEQIKVICLEKGEAKLPKNVQVFSLGKEKYKKFFFRRILYIFKLLYFVYINRREYDVVFVHMNPEYVLVCGWLWKLLRKPICLWYNHYSGSVFTDMAALFCRKIFYTSKFSYSIKFPQSMQMPVGVDTEKFHVSDLKNKIPKSTLFLGRITKSKNLDIFIKALIEVNKNYTCKGEIYGPTITTNDVLYLNTCLSLVINHNLSKKILFHQGVSSEKTPTIYTSANLFINCSKSGMYDKTIFEAAACGCIVISSSIDFKFEAGEEHFFDIDHPEQLANKIIHFLSMTENNQANVRQKMRYVSEKHSLNALNADIYQILSKILESK